MLVLTEIVSPWRLTIRPVMVRPSAIAIITAWYWSLIVLLGRTIDSSRSRTLNRPEAPERSGPVEPPSLLYRWHEKHWAAANRERPRSKSRPLSPFSTIGASSSTVQALTKGRG